MNDAPCEYAVYGKDEIVAVLEKEWAFFREENFEALVHRNLGLIRFDLAEVGIDRGVEYEAVMQDELCVEAHVGLEGAVFEERMIGIALIYVAKAANQSVWNKLDVAAGRDFVPTGGSGGLVEAPLNAVGNARPEQILVSTRNGAVQNDAPLLRASVGEAQALEGNRNQDQVATAGQSAFGAPHCVKRRIE